MNGSTDTDPVASVRQRSPLLRGYAERFADERPFDGTQIGVSAPLTPHTGLFVDVLAAGGAEVLVSGESGTTHEAVVEFLADREGVTTFAEPGMSEVELEDARRALLTREPDLLADDGAHLLRMVHDEFPDVAAGIRGACEQTTGGITRLQVMDETGTLAFPVYDVNGTPMKHHFDNVHGTAESSLTALTSLTNAMLAGSLAVVVGYGHCGRGLARKLRALGARTVVTEVDPRNALEALADGHDVRPLDEAASEAEFLLTATGRYRVVGREHIEALSDGAVLASIGSEIEIDTEALDDLAESVVQPREGVERYTLGDGRQVTLLTEGRVVNLAAPDGNGNPSEVMDTTFAMMARGLADLADGGDLPPGLHPVPKDIDRAVARETLEKKGVSIDDPSPEQRRYHERWTENARVETGGSDS
mgnify:CR=1 FL=1